MIWRPRRPPGEPPDRESEQPDRGPLQVRMTAVGHGVAVAGNNTGIIATGKYATAVQIRLSGGAAEIHDLTELRAREIPVLSTVDEREPVSRAAIIAQVAAELTGRTSVQLYGPPGAGKKAIVRAVIRKLRADQVQGFELDAPASEPHTLRTLYERLAALFFGITAYDPPEEILRGAAGALTALIVIDDCDLPASQLSRLLATFPGCVFLLTSQHPTIGRAGAAHEIEPLSREAAIELITQQIGHEAAGLQQLQFEEACQLAGGQVQRLLQYAAYVKSVTGRPGHRPPTEVAPGEIAAILISGLSEPARRVLVVLATFRVELTPGYFAAVTGLPSDPLTGPPLAAAGDELYELRLVTRGDDGAYRITADAATAVHASNWEPASPDTAARGLLPLLPGQQYASELPSPFLLLAVARGLCDARQPQRAAQFIRAAAPAALAASQVHVWIQLIALGMSQALAAGTGTDLEYFLHEEHTSALLQGDTIAAAAAIAELLRIQHTAPRSAHPVPHPARVARRLIRHGDKAVNASHGAAGSAAATSAAGGGGTVSALSVTAVVAVTAVAAAASFAGAFSAARALRPADHAAPLQQAAARMPVIAYGTGTSLVVRHGTAVPRTLATLPAGTVASQLRWSWDRRRLSWFSGPPGAAFDQVHVTDITTGITHDWTCTGCLNGAFQGGHLLVQTVQTQPPSLTAYPVGGGPPTRIPISGFPPGPDASEVDVIGSTPHDAAVLLYFSTNLSIHGELYRITTAGIATPLFPVPDNAAPGGDRGNGGSGTGDVSPDGTVLAYWGNFLGGDIGEGSDSVTMVNLVTDTHRTVSLPADAVHPLRISSVWVTSAHVIYATAWHQPGNPSTGVPANAAVVPREYRLDAGHWTDIGLAAVRGTGGRNSWTAMITRTAGIPAFSSTSPGDLSVVSGTTRINLATNVTVFAWAPSS